MANIDASLKDDQFNNLDDAMKVSLLEKSVRRLMSSVKALILEKSQLEKQVKEVTATIERD